MTKEGIFITCFDEDFKHSRTNATILHSETQGDSYNYDDEYGTNPNALSKYFIKYKTDTGEPASVTNPGDVSNIIDQVEHNGYIYCYFTKPIERFTRIRDSIKGRVTEIHIPSNVEFVPEMFADGLSSLELIVFIPVSKVEKLSYRAFSGATRLSELKLPDSLTTIDADALSYTGLRHIIIPPNVAYIGMVAFGENLDDVVMMPKIPPVVATNETTDSSYCDFRLSDKSLTIFVPKGSGDLYLSKNPYNKPKYKIVEV